MSDQLDFELKLGAAVKVFATNADASFDPSVVAASALADLNRGWRIGVPTVDLWRVAAVVGAVAVLAGAAALTLNFLANRPGLIGPQATSATPSVEPGSPAASNIATPSPIPTLRPTAASTPTTWVGPVRPDAAAMPVLAMDARRLCVFGGSVRWEDGLDAESGFVDIIETRETNAWRLELASKPPLASELDPDVALIEYGLIFDIDVDGTPDYGIGISNSPGGGDYRVWVTDLDRDETVEQIGPPYGSPVEFRHPDEQELSDDPAMAFWFLGGSGPFPANSPFRDDQRYYAWSSYSENGSVVAWDYAPDFGWLEQPACEPLPATGWPSLGQNAPGLYSWDGSTCGGQSCNIGFMHNGNGSGDVEIRIDTVAERTIDSTNWPDVAGHATIHRQIDDLREEWIVDMDGPEIRIRLVAQPGTSEADLADAAAIIESMTYEPRDGALGYRLVFTLTNDEWVSG